MAQEWIGAELTAAQELGEVADKGPNQHVRVAGIQPATLPELGIPRQCAGEYKALAVAPREADTYRMVSKKHKSEGGGFPVVCVGGSAGGLDAYIRLLQHLPADLGAAIVIVNHLRVVATQLHEILPRHTKMPVELITEGLHIRPGRVFIIPAQRDLHVLDGEFRLKPISKPRGWPDVITVFLRSLAQHWSGRLIAVIVSGYDGDGAEALCEISDLGGVTIAQKLDTAGQPDMPASAIASGCIDFILSPERIAAQIVNITGTTSMMQADLDG